MRRMSLVLFVLVVCLLAAGAAQADHPADVILYNGKVFTADGGRPWARAVAIRGSRIAAVGDDGPVRELAGPGTREIDLGGRVVVPGFNDAHVHLAVGYPRLTLPPIDIPGPGPTLEVALDQVAQAVAVAEPGEPILSIVGEALILDPAADRLAVDAVAPGEALSMEEAVTAYTRGSAYAEFQEWQKGALKPGYLADLAVLSQDIFIAPPPALPATTSLLTLVGGEVVWDAGVLTVSPAEAMAPPDRPGSE